MYLGWVTGTVVAARKAAGLEGQTLLLVQPVDDTGRATGDVQVAVDTVAAGVGDHVYLVGSREAALALTPWFVPVDAAIVGIVDDVHTPERAAAAAPEPVDDDPTQANEAPRKRPQATSKPAAGRPPGKERR
ncbi:MAG: EutN/CcmL family microcompartment protein [Kofleriaceae bacterium]